MVLARRAGYPSYAKQIWQGSVIMSGLAQQMLLLYIGICLTNLPLVQKKKSQKHICFVFFRIFGR